MSVVNDVDAQGRLPLHCYIYVTLDAELGHPYVLLLLANSLFRDGAILTTFTFEPYRYR